jgi:hypothetical protein
MTVAHSGFPPSAGPESGHGRRASHYVFIIRFFITKGIGFIA